MISVGGLVATCVHAGVFLHDFMMTSSRPSLFISLANPRVSILTGNMTGTEGYC